MNDIAKVLKAANELYYTTGESSLTDDQFDALRDEAKKSGIGISTLTASPSGTWQIVRHAYPMASIELVATSVQEWKTLFDRGNISEKGHASWKLDGLAVELVYLNGKLIHAILRGDGIEGEDVFDNVRHCRGVPFEIEKRELISICCELVISENNLSILNSRRESDGLKSYKSRRSAVAVIRARRAPISEVQLLTAIVIWVNGLNDPMAIASYLSSLVLRGVKRFIPVDYVVSSPVNAWKLRCATQSNRESLEYQLDGIVYRDSSSLVKLKFDSLSTVTTVTGIVEQLGRTGVVTPVCEFEPVVLVGAEVRRASVHNVALVQRELDGLGVGAKVLVSRRGDVIPHVERVVTPSDIPWRPSGQCPSCNSAVIYDGAIGRCSSDPGDCSGTVIGLMVKFCKELGMKWLSTGVITALVNSGVTTPAQLFTIDPNLLSEMMMPGGQCVGETRANSIYAEIIGRSAMTMGELLGSIGVPGCAKSVMEAVALQFPDPDQLFVMDVEELSAVSGVGPSRATAIAAYLDVNFATVIRPLLEVVTIKRQAGPLSGKCFCITLGLKTGSRPQVEAKIRSLGGSVRSSVTKDLTHLICNYPDERTAKLSKARELGIPVITEDELIGWMGTKIIEIEPSCDDAF